jgi:uncharacterized protein with NRDE domain
MCILGIATARAPLQSGSVSRRPRYPVVIVNNRDECLQRPTAPFEVDDETGTACYRDAAQPGGRRGGSWLGVNLRTRAFACLTNSRDTYRERRGAESRGYLVTDFLDRPPGGGEDQRPGFVPAHDRAPAELLAYDGFNLVTANDLIAVAKGDEVMLYTTNRPIVGCSDPPAHAMPLSTSLSAASGTRFVSEGSYEYHVVSNTYMDNFKEPKNCRLRDQLAALLSDAATTDNLTPLQLADGLGTALCARAKELPSAPQPMPSTDDPSEIEQRYRRAKDVFITGVSVADGVTYGTRTQSIVLVERTDDDDDTSSRYTVHYFVRDVVNGGASFTEWIHVMTSA